MDTLNPTPVSPSAYTPTTTPSSGAPEGVAPSSPKSNTKLYLILFLVVVIIVALVFGRRQSAAEDALVKYACTSDVVEKTTTMLVGAQEGVTKENFGGQTMEEMYARGVRLAQQAAPIAAAVKSDSSVMAQQASYRALLKKNDAEKSAYYLKVASRVAATCPEKGKDQRMTAEAVALVVASVAK